MSEDKIKDKVEDTDEVEESGKVEELLEVKPIPEGSAPPSEPKPSKEERKKAKKAKKAKKDKDDKPYLVEVAEEVRRVTWPTKPEIFKWSLIIVAAVAFFTLFATVADNFIVMPLMYFISGLHDTGMFDVIAIVATVVMFISGILLLITIMMHSGVDGGGLSDATATSIAGGANSLAIVEKNLNRITVALAVIFVLSLIALMLFFPQGTIAQG